MRPWKGTKPGTVMYTKIPVVHQDKSYRRGFSKRLSERRQILCTLVEWVDENYLIVVTHTKRPKQYTVHKYDCDEAT